MQALSFRLLGQVAFFFVVGALLGFMDDLLGQVVFPTDSPPLRELMPLLLLAPCLTAIAALPTWGFKVVETYWKTPLLCAIVLISWTILRVGVHALDLIPTDASGKPNLFWEALQLWTDGAVKVFAMLAYIIRAMALRTSRRMVIIFVALAAATNLIYLWADPFQIGLTWLGSVCQYSFLLGVSALAAHVFQRKRPLLKTVIEETQ